MLTHELLDIPLFAGLCRDDLDKIAPLVELVHFPADTSLFEQGNFAGYLYILQSGEVFIRYKPYDGPEIQVTIIRPGDIFGWSAMLSREQYSSTAICGENCSLYRVPGRALRDFCQRNPQSGVTIREQLANTIAKRGHKSRDELLSMFQQAAR